MWHSEAFAYQNGKLTCEGVDLESIAEQYGTPAYVYSKNLILNRFGAYRNALADISHRVCYAVKANSNLAILRTLTKCGAGFDIVSGGELYRVLAAGGDASSVVFSGVGKTEPEIRFALEKGIHSFNCESETEIDLISSIAVPMGKTAAIAIRVNPDVDAVTHPYISTGLREHKFGIDINAAERVYAMAARKPGLKVTGVSCHIGSQLLELGPLLEAADKTLALVRRLRAKGLEISELDLGGGLGVSYRPSDRALNISSFIEHLKPRLADCGLTLMLEPGRSIVAEAGLLLTKVLLIKRNGAKNFVIVDAAMNDLIRPTLYQAHHEIVSVKEPGTAGEIAADIVGPVCETGDFFARGRIISAVREGELLAILTAGAYGFVLASNYNSRVRPCELLVDGEKVILARARESYEDLVRDELASA